MKRQPTERKQLRIGLVFEYEAMSQKGTVPFFEKTAFAEIALHYHEDNNPAEALNVLVHALGVFKLSLELRFLKAATHLALGEREDAIQELQLAEVVAEDHSFSNLYRALALVSFEKENEAFDWLIDLSNTWLDHDVPDSTPKGKQGRLLSLLSTYGAMFEHFKEVVLREPDNDEALEQIWVCIELSGRHEESAALHAYLTDEAPYSSRAWYNLGYAYLNLARYDEALEALEYAYLIDPLFGQAYCEHGALSIKLGLIPQALHTYKEMLANCYENTAEAMVRIGECYGMTHEFKTAVSWFEKAIKANPLDAAALFAMAKCRVEMQDYTAALFYVKKAIRQESRREEFYILLGTIYTATNKPRKALGAYRTAVEIAPEDGQGWSKLVSHFFFAGAYRKALKVLDEGMEHCLEPELPYCRAACNFMMGDRQHGLEWLNTAYEQSEEVHPIFFEWMPDLEFDSEVREILILD